MYKNNIYTGTRGSQAVVAVMNNEFTLKRFSQRHGCPELLAENPDFPPLRLVDGDEAYVWGVVRHVIKDL